MRTVTTVRAMGRRLEPQPKVGEAVRALRLSAGLTQRQLADAADVNVTFVSHLERGASNPAWGTLTRIAAAVGVSMIDFAKLVADIEEGRVTVSTQPRVDRQTPRDPP